MAWGKRSGVDDLLARLQQPATAKSLYVLSTRSITDADAVKLAAAIAANATLEELYLSGHKLGVEGLQAFGDCLAANATLRQLCVGHDELGDAGVKLLCDGLARNPRSGLQVWDLEFKGLSHDGVAALGALLAVNSSLTTLTLARNQIGDEGMTHLVAGLTANGQSKLAVLHLTDVSVTGAGLDSLAELIESPNCSLETLALSFNDLSGASTRFFEALGANSSLRTLHLKDCHLATSHADALSAALAHNATLKELDLSDNLLDSDAVAAIARGIHTNTTLQTLKLGNNRAGDAGASAFTAGSAIVHLDLSKNELKSAGMTALLGLPSVKRLHLFSNSLGDGLVDVLPVLAANSTIETLDLGGNALHGPLSVKIFDALHTHPSLRTLEMGGNSLGVEGHAALDALRSANPALDVAVDKNVQDENGNVAQ